MMISMSLYYCPFLLHFHIFFLQRYFIFILQSYVILNDIIYSITKIIFIYSIIIDISITICYAHLIVTVQYPHSYESKCIPNHLR